MPFSGVFSSWTPSLLFLTVLILWMASVEAVDHLITVGAGGLLSFNPVSIQAVQGDTVTFEL
jgi:plastocyanin